MANELSPTPSGSSTPSGRLARLRMLSDTPLTDPRADAFGYRVYARALADLVDSEGTSTPLTVAVSAPWGAGKTSVARMVELQLHDWTQQRDGERPMVTCWFPAWMHGDAPHLGAAMAGAVATVANRERPIWRRLLQPLPAAMLAPRERWWRRVRIGVSMLLVVAIALAVRPVREAADPLLGDWSGPAEAGSTAALVLLGALLWKRLFTIAEQASHFIRDPASEAARGSMAQVREQLGGLIQQARRGGRLVVFVDDLERCSPKRAVEVCEVASQLLSHEGVVTIFVADMHAVAQAAEARQAGIEGNDSGRRFLEKIVQIELAVPPPPPDAMKRLMEGDVPELGELPDDHALHVEPSAPRRDADLQETIWMLLAVLGLGLYVGLGGGGGPRAIASRILHHDLSLWKAWLVVSAVAVAADVIANVVVAGIGVLRRWRARRKRQAINRTIHARQQQGTPQNALEEAVVDALKPRDEQLARKLVQSYLVDYAEELTPVEDVILCYPPPLPRAAKRMLNHARLLTRIARDRQLFGGDPELVPAHLGKWIVLQERWPTFAAAVLDRPRLLNSCEQDTHPASIGTSLSSWSAKLPHGDAFRELIASDPPLGEVIERLIHFEPATPLPVAPAIDEDDELALAGEPE